ncbi:MAG: hypothetical protein ACO37F_13975, partial [Pirellulales bacterium]
VARAAKNTVNPRFAVFLATWISIHPSLSSFRFGNNRMSVKFDPKSCQSSLAGQDLQKKFGSSAKFVQMIRFR